MVPDNGAFREKNSDTTFPDSPDTVDFDPHSSISSVTVELSYTSDDKPAPPPKHTTESELRPAAEVFGFLLEKRRSHRSVSMNSELPLSAFSPCPATPSNAKHLPSDLRPAEVSAWADTPSTIGSILVDPPHMATILNHTRIPVLHERPHKGSNAEQPIAMAITTRARRGHRNLQLPSGRRASTSDTYLSPVSPTEPVKPALAPAYHNGSLLSSTNTANRPSIVAPHLIPKEDGTLAPVSKRNAHRRSASYGSSRPPIPGIWDAGLDSIRKARIRGLKSDKENIISTLENAGMRMLSSFTSM